MNPQRFAAFAAGSAAALVLMYVTVVTGARAVDLMLIEEQEVEVPQVDWSGAYIGAHFGAFDSVVDYTVGGTPGISTLIWTT